MTLPSPEEVRDQAVKMYREGRSARTVARALGISHQTVLNFCRDAGVAIRPPYRSNLDTTNNPTNNPTSNPEGPQWKTDKPEPAE